MLSEFYIIVAASFCVWVHRLLIGWPKNFFRAFTYHSLLMPRPLFFFWISAWTDRLGKRAQSHCVDPSEVSGRRLVPPARFTPCSTRVPHKAGEFPPAEASLINHPLILALCARSSAPDRYPFLAQNFFSFPAVSSLVAILIKKCCIALRIYQNVCQIVALRFMLSCNSDSLERVNAPNKIKILLYVIQVREVPSLMTWDTRHALPVVQHGSASSWIGNRARRVIDRLSPL
jgi:hypothetical protein